MTKRPAVGLVLATITLARLLASAPAVAQGYEEKDIAMLPPYCRYTPGFPGSGNPATDREQTEFWKSKIGPDMFGHMHHYCRALLQTNTALYGSRNKVERGQALNASIGEFDYVIRNAKRDFVLMPEFLTKKAENLIRLGRGSEGARELNLAIEIKPDYWPPYAALGDYFKELGDIGRARETLEKGLAANPDAKALQRRIAELRDAKSGRPAANADVPQRKSAGTKGAEGSGNPK